eukprot:COSAG06_NODE_1673_length_8747_cov_3.505319_5_plen_176_part_00
MTRPPLAIAETLCHSTVRLVPATVSVGASWPRNDLHVITQKITLSDENRSYVHRNHHLRWLWVEWLGSSVGGAYHNSVVIFSRKKRSFFLFLGASLVGPPNGGAGHAQLRVLWPASTHACAQVEMGELTHVSIHVTKMPAMALLLPVLTGSCWALAGRPVRRWGWQTPVVVGCLE